MNNREMIERVKTEVLSDVGPWRATLPARWATFKRAEISALEQRLKVYRVQVGSNPKLAPHIADIERRLTVERAEVERISDGGAVPSPEDAEVTLRIAGLR